MHKRKLQELAKDFEIECGKTTEIEFHSDFF